MSKQSRKAAFARQAKIERMRAVIFEKHAGEPGFIGVVSNFSTVDANGKRRVLGLGVLYIERKPL